MPLPQQDFDDSRNAPRVLFVTSAAFNKITGGGITFSNLFRGWPRDRIAAVHSDPVPVSHDVCDIYYELGSAEITRWPRTVSARTGQASTTSLAPAARSPADRLVRVVKTAIVGNAWPDTGRLSPALEAWIESFRPQVLYTILGTIGMMELIDAIRKRFDLPLVVHFMDDWPSHLYRNGVASIVFRNRMNRLIRNLVGVAAERMAIGESMAHAYSDRYGVPFSIFQNPVDLAALTTRTLQNPLHPRQGNNFRVLYVGSIFDNAQAYSLIEVARAVARLNVNGHKFDFDIYSPRHLAEPFRKDLEISHAVRLHDAIIDDDVFFSMIHDADILVLPVNFDPTSIRLIRYSMPTKLPAYLASGTPVLVYGPAGVAQVDDAARHGWGLVVDHQGMTGVADALLKLSQDPTLAKALTDRARALVEERHDAHTVRARFQKRLAAAGTVRP